MSGKPQAQLLFTKFIDLVKKIKRIFSWKMISYIVTIILKVNKTDVNSKRMYSLVTLKVKKLR